MSIRISDAWVWRMYSCRPSANAVKRERINASAVGARVMPSTIGPQQAAIVSPDPQGQGVSTERPLIGVFDKLSFNRAHRLTVKETTKDEVHARRFQGPFVDLHVITSCRIDQQRVDIERLL